MILAILLSCCLNTPAEVTINTDTIALGAIVSLPASDPRANVNLGFSPNPGLARRFANYEIVAKIRAAGFNTDGLAFPDSILVKRRSQSLDENQVRSAVMTAFINQFPDAKVDLTTVEMPAVQVATGNISLTASLPANFDPGNRVFVRLDIQGSSFSRNVFVPVTAHIETLQPVLKTRVAANSEIHAGDLEWTLQPLEGSRETLTSFDGLEGMLAKRDLDPGQILKTDYLYTPLYVHKGDSVTVRATSGGVTISATMRAKASGKLGETIAVEQLDGTGTVSARVTGPRTLVVTQR